MSRSIPADVALLMRPMPADFAPKFEDHGNYVRWADTLEIEGVRVDVELGYSRAGAGDDAKAQESLRASAWQATELARLGRRDLLGYCMVRRHVDRIRAI